MNEVRRSQKSAANRIASILEDAEFVEAVASTYGRPLVPNRRAGLWYVRPECRKTEAYFKSTDGHINEWQFSLKRLNLHLISLAMAHDGIIIVDTTRRGKKMPDALSKTVPIWCAVLNRAILNTDLAVFPPNCVSASEQARIRSRIPDFVAQFGTIDHDLWPQLDKPLRPVFVTPDEMLPLEQVKTVFDDAYPVICVTASKKAQDGAFQMDGYTYVQGAADDHELWAPAHFSPEMLWHKDNSSLREPGISNEELLRRISTGVVPSQDQSVVQLTSHISIGPAEGTLIDLTSGEFHLAPGKRGVKQMPSVLPRICQFFEERDPAQVAIVGTDDFPHCVALMLDCRYYERGERCEPRLWVSKEEVTQRNAWLIARSGVPPSRAAQNAVGSFLRSKYVNK